MTIMEIRRQTLTAKSDERPEEARVTYQHLAPRTQTQIPELQDDQVDSLMESLSAANPRFARLLADASRSLAPLAYADNGEVTLTALRMGAALTQTQLAQLIGQKQSNVSLMESGKRENISRDTMKRMCGALGCDMNTLDTAITNTSRMLNDHLARLETRHAARENEESRRSA